MWPRCYRDSSGGHHRQLGGRGCHDRLSGDSGCPQDRQELKCSSGHQSLWADQANTVWPKRSNSLYLLTTKLPVHSFPEFIAEIPAVHGISCMSYDWPAYCLFPISRELGHSVVSATWLPEESRDSRVHLDPDPGRCTTVPSGGEFYHYWQYGRYGQPLRPRTVSRHLANELVACS